MPVNQSADYSYYCYGLVVLLMMKHKPHLDAFGIIAFNHIMCLSGIYGFFTTRFQKEIYAIIFMM